MHIQSPAMEKKEQMCVCVPINSYSVTAVKTVLFLCIVMYRLLEDFSPFLQELLLCSYFLSTCNEVLIISSTTLKINSCLLLWFLGFFPHFLNQCMEPVRHVCGHTWISRSSTRPSAASGLGQPPFQHRLGDEQMVEEKWLTLLIKKHPKPQEWWVSRLAAISNISVNELLLVVINSETAAFGLPFWQPRETEIALSPRQNLK